MNSNELKRLNFIIDIDAPREKVWEVLWDDKSYRDWTNAFFPGSYMESDWTIGGKTMFLSPEKSGMLCTIKALEVGKHVAFKVMGMIDKGVEKIEAEWGDDAVEAYTLEDVNGGTRLSVALGASEKHEQYFSETFPKSLQRVKELSESNN